MALKSIRFVRARDLPNGIEVTFVEVTHTFSILRLRRVERESREHVARCYRGDDWILLPSGAPCSLSLCFALDHLYDTHCEQPVSEDENP